jgi:SAM-dependent methyltransferase
VVSALEARGLWQALDQRPCSLAALAERLGANPGPLRAGLEMLVIQGRVSHEPDGYRVGPEADLHRPLPTGLNELYAFLPTELVGTADGAACLARWLDRSVDGWGVDGVLSGLLDGPAMLPMLIGTGQAGLVDALIRGDEAAMPALPAIRRVLLAKKWAAEKDTGFDLTAAGKFMFNRALIGGVAASYRPLLSRIDELMFGDAASVIASASEGHEEHIDRQLNVRSSGFQHEIFFNDMDKVIVDLFQHDWAASGAPAYVADMGCGDGTLLKRIYQVIREKAGRNATMIGLDFSPEALSETGKTLADIPHVLMVGDVGDPGRITREFTARTGDDAGKILHVRSFLDHDRFYKPPKDAAAAEARQRLPLRSAGVSATGGLVTPSDMYQNLIEHLKGWADILDRNGLLCLEVHAMSRWAKRAYFELSEGFYFDAIHALSRQCLCEPEMFLAAMAEVGLFPERFFKRFPKGLPYTRMTMGYYERKPWTVRFAEPQDVARIATEWARAQSFDADIAAELVEGDPGSCFVLRGRDGDIRAALFCRSGAFSPEHESRTVELCQGVADSLDFSRPLLQHALTYFSVQDGKLDVVSGLPADLWSPAETGKAPRAMAVGASAR